MQVVDRAVTDTASDTESHTIVLEAIFSPAAIEEAADKLGHDPAQTAWELADELSIQTGAGAALTEAAG